MPDRGDMLRPGVRRVYATGVGFQYFPVIRFGRRVVWQGSEWRGGEWESWAGAATTEAHRILVQIREGWNHA